MADTLYPSAGGSNIGTLLRLIQEDQNKNISSTPPGAQPGSPIRNVVQGPLHASESPGSSQVISLRPEGVTQQGPQTAPVIPAGGVSPIGVGNVVAPRAPVIAPSAPSAPGAPSQPSINPSSPNIASSTPSVRASTPALRAIPLGTSIGLNTPAKTGQVTPKAATTSKSTPQPSRIGAPIVGGTVGGGVSGGSSLLEALGGAASGLTALGGSFLIPQVIKYLQQQITPNKSSTRT